MPRHALTLPFSLSAFGGWLAGFRLRRMQPGNMTRLESSMDAVLNVPCALISTLWMPRGHLCRGWRERPTRTSQREL